MTSDAHFMTSTIGNGQHGQVIVGNGDALPIARTGNISFESGSFIFILSQVLYVPAIRKNLLSVALQKLMRIKRFTGLLIMNVNIILRYGISMKISICFSFYI